jgi:hypothetical protein
LGRANMGLDFVSGQYGCLFSRRRKYVINSLIHGHFHIGLVIIPRPILAIDSVSGQYGGLGMITRPIWKYPCIYLYIPISDCPSVRPLHMSRSNLKTPWPIHFKFHIVIGIDGLMVCILFGEISIFRSRVMRLFIKL